MSERRGVVARIYSNLGLLLSGKIAAGALSLVYLAIAARTLGPAGYGMLVLVHGYTVVVAGIVNFPGWHAVVRYGGPMAASGDHARLWSLMRFTAGLELAAGALAVAVAAFGAGVIGPHLGLDAQAQALVAPYSLAVLATVRTTPLGLLQLLRKFRLLGFHNIINPVVRLIGTLISTWCGFGLTGFLVTWLCAALIECAAMWLMGWWCLRQAFPQGAATRPSGPAWRENKGLLRFMLLANLDATFVEAVPRIGLLAVGWILGPAAAGLYSVAQRATVILSQPAILLGQAAYAELAHLVNAGETGKPLRRALRNCIGIALASSAPILLILAVFADTVIRILAGPAYLGATGIMMLLMIAQAIRLADPSLSAALIALGKPGLSVTAKAAPALGLLPLLVFLLHHFGLNGAGYHAIIEIAVAVTMLGIFCLRESGRPPARSAPAPS